MSSQVILKLWESAATSQTFHRCVSCCSFLTLQDSCKKHFTMCLHAAIARKCFHRYVYISGGRCCNVTRLATLLWSHLSLFRRLVCLSVGSGMWWSSQLDLWRKTTLRNLHDTGLVRVCYVILWCVWSPTSLRLPCFVIWSHVGLCYINRHSVNVLFKGWSHVFQSGGIELGGCMTAGWTL